MNTKRGPITPTAPPRSGIATVWDRVSEHPGWLAVAAFALALAVYWPALHATFIWDDDGHLTRRELQSFSGLARIWFELGATQQYYPVLHSAFWLEHRLFGDAPAGYHVVNVLLHAASACLFGALLRRLAVPGAGLAACLFLLHPVCVESVAWISEQKNTLSTVFYLLSALVYLRFDVDRRPRQYAIAAIFFLLALGSKTVSGTLPAALLVIFWWRRGRLEIRRDLLPLVPWFVCAAAAGAITAWTERTLIGASHHKLDLDLVEHGLLAARIFWFYLGKLLLPVNLVFIYPRWTIAANESWQFLFMLGIGLLVLAGFRWRRNRGPIAAGLIFVGTLFPTLGFVNVYPFVFSFVADHFQYLASLAFFALAGAGLTRLFAGASSLPTIATTTGLLSVLAVMTWRQSATYRDPITLYESTLAKNPSAWLAHNNLASALVSAGRPREALPHLEAAVRLRPEAPEPENSLGYALLALGDPTGAIPHFEQAMRLRSDYVYAYNNLGLALISLGRNTEAEVPLREAIRLKADYPEPHLNLGLALAQRGATADAITHFMTAVRLRPGYTEAELNLGIALVYAERPREALPHFALAAQLAPDRPEIQYGFGRALDLSGRTDDAIVRYRLALKLSPGFAEAEHYLAEALRRTGRPDRKAP